MPLTKPIALLLLGLSLAACDPPTQEELALEKAAECGRVSNGSYQSKFTGQWAECKGTPVSP